MNEDEAIAQFAGFDLFAAFSDEQLKLMAFVSEARVLEAGDVLYQAGETADGAYVLASGRMEAVHTPEDGGGRYAIVPPALIGEIGLMLTRPRATSIVAQARSELLFVPREPFLKLLRGDPGLAGHVAETLRAELANYLEQIARLGPRFSGE